MFRKLWNLIFRKIPFLKDLDNSKTIVSAILIVLAGVTFVIGELAGMLPGVAGLASAGAAIQGLMVKVSPMLEMLGVGGVYIGILDKLAKATE